MSPYLVFLPLFTKTGSPPLPADITERLNILARVMEGQDVVVTTETGNVPGCHYAILLMRVNDLNLNDVSRRLKSFEPWRAGSPAAILRGLLEFPEEDKEFKSKLNSTMVYMIQDLTELWFSTMAAPPGADEMHEWPVDAWEQVYKPGFLESNSGCSVPHHEEPAEHAARQAELRKAWDVLFAFVKEKHARRRMAPAALKRATFDVLCRAYYTWRQQKTWAPGELAALAQELDAAPADDPNEQMREAVRERARQDSAFVASLDRMMMGL